MKGQQVQLVAFMKSQYSELKNWDQLLPKNQTIEIMLWAIPLAKALNLDNYNKPYIVNNKQAWIWSIHNNSQPYQ